MKNSTLKIMLLAISATLPINAFAAIDPATLERQRKANQAALSKSTTLKRHFDKSKAENQATLKLDALPQSPHRRAITTSAGSEQTIQASPRRTSSASLEQISPMQK